MVQLVEQLAADFALESKKENMQIEVNSKQSHYYEWKLKYRKDCAGI